MKRNNAVTASDNQPAAVFRSEVMAHQRLYPSKTVIEIAQHFGMDRKPTDIKAIQDILDAPGMRRYRKAGGWVSPVKPGANRAYVRQD